MEYFTDHIFWKAIGVVLFFMTLLSVFMNTFERVEIEE